MVLNLETDSDDHLENITALNQDNYDLDLAIALSKSLNDLDECKILPPNSIKMVILQRLKDIFDISPMEK